MLGYNGFVTVQVTELPLITDWSAGNVVCWNLCAVEFCSLSSLRLVAGGEPPMLLHTQKTIDI